MTEDYVCDCCGDEAECVFDVDGHAVCTECMAYLMEEVRSAAELPTGGAL